MCNKLGLTGRYLLAFILMLVIPFMSINLITNKVYSNLLLKASSEKTLQSMEQISRSIEEELMRLITAEVIITDETNHDLIDMVTDWHRTTDSFSKLSLGRAIDSKLSYLFNYRNDIETVIFFFKEQGNYYYRNALSIDEKVIREMSWYQECANDSGQVKVIGNLRSITGNPSDLSIDGTTDKYVLAIAISPKISRYRGDIEVVYLALRLNLFDKIFSGLKYSPSGEFLIIDATGNIIVSESSELLGKKAKNCLFLNDDFTTSPTSYLTEIDGVKKFIATYPVSKTNWNIVKIIDYQILTADVERVSRFSLLIYTLIIFLFSAFSVLFFTDLINPINNLIKKMKKVENGEFDVYVGKKGNGEIQRLSNSFNEMVRKIERLIAERDLKEKLRNKAELEALQYQINPHFIFNTLNSIRLMAMVSKVESIKNVSEAFMRILSATLGGEGSVVTVETEIQTVKNYVYLMKVRYGDKFSVEYEIDNQIKHLKMTKMLLQPIIENAIFHGVSELERKGKILIKGYLLDGNLVFKVSDNGKGMTQTQIKTLFEQEFQDKKGFTKIGIANVNKRIKLNHGENYGITIDSQLGEYTTVEILLPAINQSGGENSISSIDC
ncbi:MAG TPA: hypothetical protein DDZ91_07095 [Firmicutes bacterium]|nr:hypothetical protein [Bacillota bacterium]